MRGFFWSRVGNRDLTDSIWLKKDIAAKLVDVQIDESELEDLFAKKETAPIAMKEETKKVEKVMLIDPKKSQNAAISLTSMRLDNKTLRSAILRMDDSVLNAENIKILKDIAPTDEELQAIREFEGDDEQLGPTELFYKIILDIPRMEQRLTTWLFKQRFASSISSVQPDVENVLLASTQLQESEKLFSLLEYILAIGNFLNSGKKATHGFQMDTLLKLRDMRATGAKMNLLEYIVLYIERTNADLMDWHKELSHVEPSHRVSLASVMSEINDLRSGISRVAAEIEKAENNNDPDDMYRIEMIEFLDMAEQKLEDLEETHKEMEESLENLRKLFAEPVKKWKPEDFFNTFHQFITAWNQTWEEIERKREAERKKLEREEKKRQQLEKLKRGVKGGNKSKSAADNRPKKTVLKKDELSDGLMDETIANMADGSAFKRRTPGKTTRLRGANIDVEDIMANMEKKAAMKKSAGAMRRNRRAAATMGDIED